MASSVVGTDINGTVRDVNSPLRLGHVLRRRTIPLIINADTKWDIPVPDLNALATFEELGGNLNVFMGGDCAMKDWGLAVYACGMQMVEFSAAYPSVELFCAEITIDNLDSFGECLNGLRTPASPELANETQELKEAEAVGSGEPFQGVELPDDVAGVPEGV